MKFADKPENHGLPLQVYKQVEISESINAELLEALRVIEEEADYASVRDEVFKDILQVARAAIKKATQEE